MEYLLGIDIGGTKISAGIVDHKGDLKDVVTVPTLANEPAENTLKQLLKSLIQKSEQEMRHDKTQHIALNRLFPSHKN